MKPRWKRGVVLLQTLVMAIVLSTIAVMLMKWILARYLLAARNYRATEASSRSQAVTGQVFSGWSAGTVPSGGTTYIDGKPVTYQRQGNTYPYEFKISIDEDN